MQPRFVFSKCYREDARAAPRARRLNFIIEPTYIRAHRYRRYIPGYLHACGYVEVSDRTYGAAWQQWLSDRDAVKEVAKKPPRTSLMSPSSVSIRKRFRQLSLQHGQQREKATANHQSQPQKLWKRRRSSSSRHCRRLVVVAKAFPTYHEIGSASFGANKTCNIQALRALSIKIFHGSTRTSSISVVMSDMLAAGYRPSFRG